MDKTVKYAIEIVNRWEEPIKNFEKKVRTISNKKVTDPFRDLPRSLSQLKHNLDRYKKSSDEAFRTDHIRRYGVLISQTEKKIHSLENAQVKAIDKSNHWGESLKKAGILYMAYRGASMAKDFAFGDILAAAQFEKYQTTLKVMLGSRGAARERISEYSDIAQKTPFELQQVVEAGNQLQAIGRYSRKNVTMLGDLGAASGKPLEQVMGAYAKLSTGQKGEGVNMFRDLLISTDDWIKATGKGISKNGELIATTEEMLAALPKIMKSKGFFGMMDQQSKTTEGQISNLKDSFFGLKEAMGERMKPAFDRFLAGSSGIVESLKKWVEIPLSEKIAQEKSDLNSLVGIITDATTSIEDRTKLIAELQQQYPEFLSNLDAEKVTNQELLKVLKEVNDAYDRKINIAAEQSFADDKAKQVKEKGDELQRKKDVYKYSNREEAYKQWFFQGYGFFPGDNPEKLDLMYSTMLARKMKNPKDKEANNFIKNVFAYRVSREGNLNSRGFLPGLGIGGDNNISPEAMKKLKEEINKGQEELNYLNKIVSSDNNADILIRAKAFNLKNPTTLEEYFGDQKQKGAKDLLSQFSLKRSTTEAKLTQDDYDWLDAIMKGDLKFRSSGPGGSLASLEKASDSITGGGKNIKQINITLESLIHANTNIFDKGDNPADATTFMEKLTTALESIVNDVNYSAG
ncbi:MAG: hypothetical protein ACYC6C_05585 [Coriobacteriia bacterium]